MVSVTIRARQALFSRVEANAFRGKGRDLVRNSGYYFAFYSSAISDEAETALKERIQCFKPERMEHERLQYFFLPSGRAVITSSIQITPDKIINDSNERGGAFIAHCLVIEPAEFEKVNNDPFAVIEAFSDRIIVEPSGLIEVAENPDQEEEVKITVELRQPSLSGYAQSWPQAELEKLILSGEQDQGGRTFQLVGAPDDVEEVLRVAFAAADKRTRRRMTFDTSVVKECLPPAGSFWVTGTTKSFKDSKFPAVNLDDPKVTTLAGAEGNPKELSVYANWLRHSLKAGRRDEMVAHAFTAQRIAAALEAGRSLDEVENVEVVDQFLAVNEQHIVSCFKDTVREWLSNGMVEALYASIATQRAAGRPTFSGQEIITAAATGKFTDAQALSNYVYAWLLDTNLGAKYPNLTEDAAKLSTLAAQGRHHALAVVGALLKPDGLLSPIKKMIPFARNRGRTPVQEALAQLDVHTELPEVFRNLMHFDWAAPSRFVVPETATALGRHFAQNPPAKEQDLFAVLEALYEQGDTLADFAPHVARLSSDNVKRLQKLIGKSTDSVDPTFRQAVDARLNQSSTSRR